MKTLLFFVILFTNFGTLAQNIMGIAPGGTAIQSPNELIISQVVGNGDSVAFDIDCDSIPDIKFVVVRGAIPLDGHNNAYCGSLDTNLEICRNTTLHYYNLGDTALCDSPFVWSHHPRFLFSCLGLDCMQINVFTDTFISYRKQISPNVYKYGWALISLNLKEPAPSLTLKEFLSFCYPLSTPYVAGELSAKVYPTVFTDRILIEALTHAQYEVTLYDASAQKIFSSQNTSSVYTSALPPGFYYLKVIADHTISTYKLIKH